MERISLLEVWEHFLSYGVAGWSGIISAVIVFIIEIILVQKRIIFSGDEKKLERAKKAGHVITGIRTHSSYKDRSPENKTANRMYSATYKYSINGYEGKKTVVSTSFEPPTSINLYYEKSPRKVFSEYDLNGSPLQILIYLIPVLVAAAVMKLMGYDFNR